MKILNSNNRNFDKSLESLLLKRKNKIKTNSVSVIKIINDVRKNSYESILNFDQNNNRIDEGGYIR